MKKIISLFARNYDGDRLVRDEIVPGAEWVADGFGVATRKFDGTCCLVCEGKLFKRYDAKAGKKPPAGFLPAEFSPDPHTGHWPGWLEVGDGPDDRWHREAWNRGGDPGKPAGADVDWEEGTYELCGPKVQGNPESFGAHMLVRHGEKLLPDAPRTFAALRQYLGEHDIEGIVWYHADGRLVKVKGKDFGLKRVQPHYRYEIDVVIGGHPNARCNQCGRATWDDAILCEMPQPDGSKCRGVFIRELSNAR